MGICYGTLALDTGLSPNEGGTMVFEWLLLASIPAIGALILVLVMNRWGSKHDPMGGRPGHVWEPDDVERGRNSG